MVRFQIECDVFTNFLNSSADEQVPWNFDSLTLQRDCRKSHGFQTLEEDSELLYLHTAFYEPSSEGGVNYTDPRVNIAWPLPTGDISDRDKNYPLLDAAFKGF